MLGFPPMGAQRELGTAVTVSYALAAIRQMRTTPRGRVALDEIIVTIEFFAEHVLVNTTT